MPRDLIRIADSLQAITPRRSARALHPTIPVWRAVWTWLFVAVVCTVSLALPSNLKITQFAHAPTWVGSALFAAILLLLLWMLYRLRLGSAEVALWKKTFVAVLIGLITSSAQALDPTRAISQYAHTAWLNRDGYFSSAPSAITQTKDGYIWIGTATDLMRFDGVRFTSWTPPKEGQPLPSHYILSLFASSDGSLWIGTAGGLARWYNGKLTEYPTGYVHIDAIVEDPAGHIWIGRAHIIDGTDPLCEVVGSTLRCYGRKNGIPEPQISALAADSSGILWIGGEGALTRWTPHSSRTFHPLAAQRSVHTQVGSLAVDQDGSLWVGFFGSGHGLGLERFQNGAWRPVNLGTFHGYSFQIPSPSIFTDSANSLWIGTDSEGIYRIHGNTVEHFDTSDGLSGDDVLDLFEDKEHNLWVATSSGIDCFRDLPVVSYGKREGLTTDQTNSVYAAKDGTVWVGLVGGLDAIRNGIVSPVSTGNALPGSEVTAMLVDRTGRLWLGVDDGLYVYEHGHFHSVVDTHGKRSGVITDLAEDAEDGSIWAVDEPNNRLLHIRGDVIRERFPENGIIQVKPDPKGGVWLNLYKPGGIVRRQNGVQTILEMPPGIHIDFVKDIALDDQGALWASISQGVLHFDRGRVQLLGAGNGLPCPSRGNLIFDKQGSLWLTQSCGIVRINQNNLHSWIRDPEAKVSTLTLDRFDGVQLGFSDFQPSVALGSDGRLWFVTGYAIQMLDPAHLHMNALPPPVHIEQLIADHKKVAIAPAIHLPPLTRDLEIDYTALSFVVPQHVRFRYKLEGHNGDWQEAGTRRSAFYTNLRPGPYRFLVTACNNSGVWNNQGATFEFVILPAWYQTIWFRLVAFLSLALFGYAFYLLRMLQYAAAMRARFNERLDERVRIARELHDTLLQSFHGLMFQFQAARNLLPGRPESAMQTMDEAIIATEQALAEGRDAIHDLRPESAAEHDLAELLTSAGQELAGAEGTKALVPSFQVIVEGRPQKLCPTLQDEIFRIGREVIRNAFHHAVASHIEVEIRYDERELRLRIRDDGKGIDSKVLEASGRPGHWGLTGLRERAQRIGSRLQFWSDGGAGTEVELRVPAAVAYEKKRDGHRFRLFRWGGSNGGRS